MQLLKLWLQIQCSDLHFICLLYKHTNGDIFDDFPKISAYFSKIFQDCSKGQTNVSKHFLIISEDDWRCFNQTPPNLSVVKGTKEKCYKKVISSYVRISHIYLWCFIIYKHQWNTKWAFARKLHILKRENNMLFSHVKRSPSLWLQNKSRLFHWCLYIKLSCAHLWDIALNTRR